MKKIVFFTLCVALLGSCVSQKKYDAMLMRNQFDKDSLQWLVNNCQKNLEKTTALEEQLEKMSFRFVRILFQRNVRLKI